MNYQKKMKYSFTLGAYPTIELCLKKPQWVRVIYLHPKISPALKETIIAIAQKSSLEYIETSDFFRPLEKENIFLAAKFTKYTSTLEKRNHLILHQPEVIGNLGTIFRSALAFGIKDIALIDPSCDEFHPQCIRASMGGIFSLRLEHFDSMQDYEQKFSRPIYAFMTGQHPYLQQQSFEEPCGLLFGSESSGLPLFFEECYHATKIKMSPDVDSLNLPLAVGIALHHLYEG